ncbi:hypothetical protein VHEMI02531 [[Torrubiella] hemipterigena]|uniref:Uncharacterized protein n=1 Tax=[Torrubiella] hemipterigena TaxID=1531966 RepID=A0A0A1TAS0_9HYPO|nr:hypothetical protein VHEMI02531 [[Torrubiella] hemipterigena]
MEASKDASKVAYCEDVNPDTDKSIAGTRQYARTDEGQSSTDSCAPNSPVDIASPLEGRSGASSTQDDYSDSTRSSRESLPKKSSSSKSKSKSKAEPKPTSRRTREAEPAERPRGERRSSRPEASHKRSAPPPANAKMRRPTVGHASTYPAPPSSSRRISTEDASGYPPKSHSSSNVAEPQRPRPKPRPLSYSGAPPPTANMGAAWAGPGYPAPQMGYPAGSRGHHLMPVGYPGGGEISPQSPIGPPPPFADMPMSSHDHLRQRFVSSRPPSSSSHRDPGMMYPQDEYIDPPRSRRPSRTRQDDDRMRMPPPVTIPHRTSVPHRAMSAVPQSSGMFRPPSAAGPRPQIRQNPSRAPASRRYSQEGEPDYEYGLYPEYADMPPQEPHYATQGRRNSGYYEQADMIPAGHRNRRSSGYNGGPIYGQRRAPDPMDLLSADIHENLKLSSAQQYQERVGGMQHGGPTPLTMAALNENTRRGVASSRSTRSSGSRDDSEQRHSLSTAVTSSAGGATEATVTLTVNKSVNIEFTPNGQIRMTTENHDPRLGMDRMLEDRGRGDTRSHGRPRQQSLQSRYPPQGYHQYDDRYMGQTYRA